MHAAVYYTGLPQHVKANQTHFSFTLLSKVSLKKVKRLQQSIVKVYKNVYMWRQLQWRNVETEINK